MERIAVISDIHGNMPALHAVLEDIHTRGIERIVCLGDLAGKGPSSAESVDLIRETCEVVIQGNWDFFLAHDHPSPVFQWHQARLGQERLEYLGGLPLYQEFFLSGSLIRLCHASPNDLFHRTYVHSSPEERKKLFLPTPTLDMDADVVGYGDIHAAHLDYVNRRTIFNAGSVGNSLDLPQASYGILEGVSDSRNLSPLNISIVRVPFDIEKAICEAQDSEMPEIDEYSVELRTGRYRGRKD